MLSHEVKVLLQKSCKIGGFWRSVTRAAVWPGQEVVNLVDLWPLGLILAQSIHKTIDVYTKNSIISVLYILYYHITWTPPLSVLSRFRLFFVLDLEMSCLHQSLRCSARHWHVLFQASQANL